MTVVTDTLFIAALVLLASLSLSEAAVHGHLTHAIAGAAVGVLVQDALAGVRWALAMRGGA